MTQNYPINMRSNSSPAGNQADPEVVPRAKRRSFSPSYKLRILEEAGQCERRSGQLGALLRREGLYSSHLTAWRRQRAAGQLAGLSPKKRGRKKNEQAAEIGALRKENERLRSQLDQTELIIAAQKKLAEALEQTLRNDEEER